MAEKSLLWAALPQQYLAEVERTITDPTLTSTYEAFQGGTNTKQDLLYPYSFFEEDVMTAINRLSKILQDNLKLMIWFYSICST
jgi:hypothetical protein